MPQKRNNNDHLKSNFVTLLDKTHCYYNGMHRDDMGRVIRKPVFGVSDQVMHKPGCTSTEDDLRLEISDLGSRENVLYI